MPLPTPRLSPPFNEKPLDGDGYHSTMWESHHQDLVDHIATFESSVHDGVTDGSDAAAGQIGEYMTSVVPAPGVGVGAGVTVNITSLPLTPGDWDVSGEVWLHLGSGSTTAITGAVGTTSATLPGPGGGARESRAGAMPVSDQVLGLSSARISASGPVTVYLMAAAGGAAVTAYGAIRARRVR